MRRSVFFPVLLALGLGSLIAASIAIAQTDRTSPGTVGGATVLPVSMAYSSQDGLIVVKATVGTGLAQDAVIATALPITLITPDLATKQAIQGQGIVELATIAGPARVQGGTPQVVTIGRVPVSNVPIGIFDLYPHLSARSLPGSPALWLGWSALGGLCFTIDPEKREVTFQPTAMTPPRKSLVVPFEVQNGRIYLQAKLNGHRAVRMLVDTASVGTLLPADAARALRLPEVATLMVKAAGGKESRVTAVTLNELAIGGSVKIKDLRALYVSAGESPELGPDTGILGSDAILRHRVTINYARSTMTFETIEPKKETVRGPLGAPPTNPAPGPAAPPKEIATPVPLKKVP